MERPAVRRDSDRRERGVMTITRPAQRGPKRSRQGGISAIALRESNRIRWSKVMAAQARMASGYYDRDEVQQFLVEALLRELRRH
jgi:hypothetical protein